MMWSCGCVFEGRKEGSGFTLRAFRVRLKVDLSRLQAAQMKLRPLLESGEGLKGMEKSGDAIVLAKLIDIWL